MKFLWLLSAVAAAEVAVTVYDGSTLTPTSGRAPKDSGKPVSLSPELFGDSEDAEFCSKLRAAADYPVTGGCNVHDGLGHLVRNFEGVNEGESLHIVASDKLFVWPTVALGHNTSLDIQGQNIVMETIADSPRIFRLHNFLTTQEVDNLLNIASELSLTRSTGGLQKAGGKDPNNKGSVSSHRTSDNSWDQTSPTATNLKRRSFELLRIPFREAWADGLQVVRYFPSQFYHSHQDWFELGATQDGWDFNPKTGGSNRFATIFLYLSDHTAGGETVFPRSMDVEEDPAQTVEYDALMKDVLRENSLEWKMMKDCRNKFSVKPRKGDAILFYHQDVAGNLDIAALHGACPVLSGEKWGANLWIWNGPVYQPEGPKKDGQSGPNSVSFTNTLNVPVQLWWTNPEGTRQLSVMVVDPGAKHQQQSTPGSRFKAYAIKPDGARGRTVGDYHVSSIVNKQDFVIPRARKKRVKKTEL